MALFTPEHLIVNLGGASIFSRKRGHTFVLVEHDNGLRQSEIRARNENQPPTSLPFV